MLRGNKTLTKFPYNIQFPTEMRALVRLIDGSLALEMMSPLKRTHLTSQPLDLQRWLAFKRVEASQHLQGKLHRGKALDLASGRRTNTLDVGWNMTEDASTANKSGVLGGEKSVLSDTYCDASGGFDYIHILKPASL